MHVHPRCGSWATRNWLNLQGQKAISLRYSWDTSTKGVNPNRKSSVHQDYWWVGLGAKKSFQTDLRSRPRHVQRKNETFIATWNVRSLLQPGKTRELEEELEKY